MINFELNNNLFKKLFCFKFNARFTMIYHVLYEKSAETGNIANKVHISDIQNNEIKTFFSNVFLLNVSLFHKEREKKKEYKKVK